MLRFRMRRLLAPTLTALLLGTCALEAQTIQSQTISKEVALAIQQEQQASELAAKGRAAEAETLYRQSLATIETSLPGDPILAGSLNNVAEFYRKQRRFSEAAELLNRALAIYGPIYGDAHTLTATVINNLANTYLADRKYRAAEPLFRRSSAATETLLGPDNAAVASSLNWLGWTIFLQGRHGEAETHLRRGIVIAEKATGPDTRLMYSLVDHLYSVVQAQGRDQEAAALKARAQQILMKTMVQ